MKNNKNIDDEINSRVPYEGNFEEISDKITINKKGNNKKRESMRACYIVALLSLVIPTIVVPLINHNNFNGSEDNSNNVSSSYNDGESSNKFDIIYSPSTEMQTSNQDWLVEPWGQKNIVQKYPTFTYDNKIYYFTNPRESNELDIQYLDEFVSQIVVEGHDIYEDKNYSINADIYKIKKIDSDCSLAIKFADDEHYYAYSNPYYEFQTLEDFIDKLNLKEYLILGNAYYNYTDSLGSHNIRFDDFDDSYVWEMLLNNTDIINESLNNNTIYKNSIISISSSIPVLGISNVSLALNADGYIQTNILDTAKCFYIGMEKCNIFIDYIIENVKGYEIIYNNGDSTQESDSSSQMTSGGYIPE